MNEQNFVIVIEITQQLQEMNNFGLNIIVYLNVKGQSDNAVNQVRSITLL